MLDSSSSTVSEYIYFKCEVRWKLQMKQKRKRKASHGWFWLLGSLVVKEKPQHSNSCSSARLNYMLIWPRLVLWGAPPHLRCPFSFLFLAGVLIGWLAAPFSFGTGAAAVGGDIGEKGSGSPSRLDLNGPAGENFKGLKEKNNNGQVIINMSRKDKQAYFGWSPKVCKNSFL